jgi:hypothetical protein
LRPFVEKFPRIGEQETRVITVFGKGDLTSMPPDQYALVELYCEEKGCDCRRAMISVFARKAKRIVATINMGFDAEDEDSGPFLDPLNPQSRYSQELIRSFVDIINSDPHYLARLQRHYVMFKEKVDGKPYRGRPFDTPGKVERVVKEVPGFTPEAREPASRQQTKVGRNQPCPCGSGKKYKKCCMMKSKDGFTGKGPSRTVKPIKTPVNLDDKKKTPGPLTKGTEIKEAKAMVKQVARRLDRDTQGHAVDQNISLRIQENPHIAFVLLHLLLEVYASKGRAIEMGTSYEAALILLEEALTEIRFSVDRNRPWAVDLAEQIQKEIALKAFQVNVDALVQADLVRVLRAAGLKASPEIKKKSEEIAEYYNRFVTRTGPPDLDRLFDQMAAGGPDSPFDLYEQIMAQFDLLSVEGLVGAIAEMLRARNPLIRELAGLTLLHPNDHVRTQVPLIWLDAASPDTVHPVTLRRMIGLRNWLPKVERPILDEVIKKVRLARVECAPMPQVKSIEVYISPFDGSGIQGAWIVSQEKRHYGLSGVLVRQGEGIREGWGQHDMGKREVMSTVREMTQKGVAEPLNSAYLGRLISHFIWVGHQHGSPPPPGLLQVAEMTGHEYWHPRPVLFEEEFVQLEKAAEFTSLSRKDIARIVDDSGEWHDTKPFASSWFEDDARVDDLLKGNIGLPLHDLDDLGKAIDLVMVEVLEEKSDVWMERLLWMALWARAAKGRDRLPWLDFFILAREIRLGTPLKRIPFMVAVARRTVYSALRRMELWPK